MLVKSQLLPAPVMQNLQQRWIESITPQAAEQMIRDLVQQKYLTDYQAEIVLAGHHGPFHFGKYLLLSRYNDGPLVGQFKARHLPTEHPVVLEFWSGKSSQDLKRWQQAESQVLSLSEIESSHLLSIYESVVTPEFRFVASQRPEGTPLSERLPRRARLPWKDVCLVMGQVASGLEALHGSDFHHGFVSPRSIWLSKSGFVQLRFELQPSLFTPVDGEDTNNERKFFFQAPELSLDAPATAAGDWYSFGCCLWRILAGKPVFDGGSEEATRKMHLSDSIPDVSRYEFPTELTTLMQDLLAKDPAKRKSVPSISSRLISLAQKKSSEIPKSSSTTLAAYRKSISQFLPRAKTETIQPPVITVDGTDIQTKPLEIDGPFRISTSAEASDRNLNPVAPRSSRKKKKWMPILMTLAGIWVFCGLLLAGAYFASGQGGTPANGKTNPEKNLAEKNPESNSARGDADGSVTEAASAPTILKNALIKQKLIKDDRATLWESPTNGARLELTEIPAAPKIILTIRPQEMLASEEGKLLLKGLGPALNEQITRWLAMTKVDLEEIEQLVVSFHSNDSFQYDAFVRCKLVAARDSSELLANWGQPEPRAAERTWFVSRENDRAFLLLRDQSLKSKTESKSTTDGFAATGEENKPVESAVESAIESTSEFAIGTPRLIEEVASLPSSGLDGIMKAIADRADESRHINILFLRTGLVNDEGQALMGERLLQLNRAIAVLLPDAVPSGLISLHLDQGTYLELQFDRLADVKGIELKSTMEEELRKARDAITNYVTAIPPSPYWDKVRQKFNLMLVDFFRNLRWGVEQGEVVANVWLPPMAAHNLVAAAEMSVTFSSGSANSGAGMATRDKSSPGEGPQSLADLLETKRDLIIANPPDLNLLMSELEAAVREDFPALPFAFKIRLMGPDLQLEGITQNQRPAELKIKQQTLSQILTSIMTSANPAKDISGPSDPKCKLVWAIADDPEDDNPGDGTNRIILITTRKAAGDKKYELPTPFTER